MVSARELPTEGALGRRIELEDAPALVGRDDAVEGFLDDRAVERRALALAALGEEHAT